MSNYVQTFKVPVGDGIYRRYGIEDYAAPGDHFFDGRDYKSDPQKRFHLWSGGCGVGHAATLEEARERLTTYIARDTADRIRRLSKDLDALDRVADALGHPSNIDLYSEEDEDGH